MTTHKEYQKMAENHGLHPLEGPEQEGEYKVKYAIWAKRSPLSIFGSAETWCKQDGHVELFTTEREAIARAMTYNAMCTSGNVSYTVKIFFNE